MTFAGNSQIIDLYETSGLSPEEISSALDGMNVVAIKAVLQQGSAKFREDSKVNTDLSYSASEAEEAKQVALALMRYSEDDRLRAKIALRVIDDKKGRLEPQNTANSVVGALSNLNINIQVIQEQLAAGRAALSLAPKEGVPRGQSLPIPEKEAKMLADARAKR